MAETVQPETARNTLDTDGAQAQSVPAPAGHAASSPAAPAGQHPHRYDPALRPLPSRPRRHTHHGQTPAMWTGTACVFAGFLFGGFVMMAGHIAAGVVVVGVLIIVGVVVGLILQALGLGQFEKKHKS